MSVQDSLISDRKNISSEGTPAEPEDMILRRIDNGVIIHYDLVATGSEKVQWVSLETDSNGNPLTVRTPKEVTTVFGRNDELTVAGKTYSDFSHILKSCEGELGEDIYGRKVLYFEERFPCFDSFDYLYENRYYRWIYIRNGNSISRVFAADEQANVYVTEDVQNVDSSVWNKMKRTGFCQSPKH